MIWSGETYEQAKSRWSDGVECFALVPRQMADGNWVWLEKYWSAWTPTHSGNGYWYNALTFEGLAYRYPQTPPPPRK